MNKALISLLGFLALTSCGKLSFGSVKEPEPDMFICSYVNLDSKGGRDYTFFDSKGGSDALCIKSDEPWTATSPTKSCFSIDRTSGPKGTTYLIVSAEVNTSVAERRDCITITNGIGSFILDIVQEGECLVFEMSENEVSLPEEGGEFEIKINSNTVYDLSIPVDWVHEIKTKTVTPSVWKFKVDTSYHYDPRSTTLSFVTEKIPGHFDKYEYQLTINQARATILEVDTNVFNVDYKAGQCYLNVKTNTSFDVKSDSDWCTCSSPGQNTGNFFSTYSLPVSFTENTSTQGAREATITISSANGKVSHVVKLIQGAAPFVTVSQTEFSLPCSDASAVLEISSNTEWSIACNSDWITLDKKSGNGNDVINIKLEDNNRLEPRSATLYVRQDPYNGTDVVIVQKGVPPYLNISNNHFDFPYEYSGATFTVQSNCIWYKSSDKDWVEVYDEYIGNSCSKVQIYVHENQTLSPRNATITITTQFDEKYEVTLSQAATDPYLKFPLVGVGFIPAAGCTFPLEFSSNIQWVLTSDQPWCTLNPSSGEGDGRVDMIIEANPQKADRTLTVTLTSPNSDFKKTLTFIQDGAE